MINIDELLWAIESALNSNGIQAGSELMDRISNVVKEYFGVEYEETDK